MELQTTFRKILAALFLAAGRRQMAARVRGVQIGQGCRIYNVDYGSEPFLIKIGNRVTIAPGVRFVTHDGSLCLVKDVRGRRYLYQPIEIGDDVFIGVGAIILPGVRIGSHVVIGAGSLLNASVPDGTVVAGVPARKLRSFEEYRAEALRTTTSEDELDFVRPYKARILAIARRGFRRELR